MPRYSDERKAAVLKKLLPPLNRSVASVATEEGISDVTLYSWLKQCRQNGAPVPGNQPTADTWSPDAKLAVVIETAPLSEVELAAYCREKGLYVEQVHSWKAACLQGAAMQQGQEKEALKQQREARKTIKKLHEKTGLWLKPRLYWCFQKSWKPCTGTIRTARSFDPDD